MNRNRLPTSKFWCFTINNPHELAKEDLFESWEDKVQYAIWQLERVTTEHIQGYVILKRHNNLNFIKRI